MEYHDWYGLYGESWKGAIVDEAFSHPAKVSRALVRHIYEHAVEEGWLKPGDSVADPFGGIGGCALDAMRLGMNWYGVELEQKFVDLCQQNLDFWDAQFAGVLPNWGTGSIMQGDSRQLCALLEKSACVVSSPPYNPPMSQDHSGRGGGDRGHTPSEKGAFCRYGNTEGQLEGMKMGDVEAVIGSPPFGAGETRDRTPVSPGNVADCIKRSYTQDKQGTTPGNLATMDACIGSPPYEAGCAHTGGDDKHPDRMDGGEYHGVGYQAVVSSPPYSNSAINPGNVGNRVKKEVWKKGKRLAAHKDGYGSTEGQLGAEKAETFWGAAKTIVEQVYDILVPGGHCIWVTKRFVRDKQIVEFSEQWAALCQSVGFELVHWHKAWLIEDRGAQYDLFGELQEKTVKRMSFFRRLYEAKYPENAIDWEDVICFVKPSA